MTIVLIDLPFNITRIYLLPTLKLQERSFLPDCKLQLPLYHHANGKQAYSYHPTPSADDCPAEQNGNDVSSNNIHPSSVPALFFCQQ